MEASDEELPNHVEVLQRPENHTRTRARLFAVEWLSGIWGRGRLLTGRYGRPRPESALLDGTTDGACPVINLPPVPNAMEIVHRNVRAYSPLGFPPARMDDSTREMALLDLRLGLTLKSLFAECGIIDLWPSLWSGNLAVSGALILQLLEHNPYAGYTLQRGLANIDLYLHGDARDLIVDGNLAWRDDSRTYGPDEAETVELHGFTRPAVQQVIPHRPYWLKELDTSGHWDKLPSTVRVFERKLEFQLHYNTHGVFHTYYSGGRLQIPCVGAFLTKHNITPPRSGPALSQYLGRDALGYDTNSEPHKITVRTFDPYLPINIHDCGWIANLPLSAQYKFSEENGLEITLRDSGDPDCQAPLENILKRLLKPRLSHNQMHIILRIASMYLSR